MTTFAGTDGVATFQAIALKSALKLYAKTGMKPNRAWTPTAMLRLASHITGQNFKRGEYMKAHDAVAAWLDENGTSGT